MKMKFCGRNWAAAAVLALALCLTACGPNMRASESVPADTEGDLGTTLSTMFFDYTVLSAESPSAYDGYTALEGKKLLVCSVNVKNDFGEALPMYASDFWLQWGEGDEDYAWPVDPFTDRMTPLEYELADRAEVTYDLLFEVPADQNEFALVYLEEYYDADGNDCTGKFYSAYFTLQ